MSLRSPGLPTNDALTRTRSARLGRVLGTEERTRSIAIVCRPHSKIESVVLHPQDMVLLKLRAPSDDECQSLVLAPRDGRWAMTGTWFCGVSNYEREIRRRLASCERPHSSNRDAGRSASS